MKKMFIVLILIFAFTNINSQTSHTINTSGFTFVPNTLNINVGDTVKFELESIHTAREVEQSTWNANGTTQKSGGFDLGFGGGTVVLNTPGTVYYVCVPHASSGMKGTITVNSVTDVKSLTQTIPDNFILLQNYPNPFNPKTRIRFGLISESIVSLKIYNSLGEEVKELLNNTKSAGFYEMDFNAENLSSGIYFYRLTAVSTDNKNTFSDTKKLILLK